MPEINDEYMKQRLAAARPYTVVILHHGPSYGAPGAENTIWEHGRRNMQLQADGLLSIVCPVNDGSDIGGIAIFAATPTATQDLLADDPAVVADVLRASVHASFGFPHDSLPGDDR